LKRNPVTFFHSPLCFGDSNDLFFAPDGNGIALFNTKGQPISGDITLFCSALGCWPEVNQEPFVVQIRLHVSLLLTRAHQNTIRFNSFRMFTDGFSYPSVAGMIKVTITAKGGAEMNMMARR